MSKSPGKSPQRRMNRKDLDSSVHRLSRVREQYKSNKAVQDERHESFVLNYYKANPQEMDTRAPEEKLKEIQDRLNEDDVEGEERHRLLSQQKQLCYFAHGEDSAEMISCEKQLGMYYNRNKRPASAVRHLQKAQQLQQTNNIDPEESMEIAVEKAEAHLSLRDVNKRQETMKHMTQAAEALKPTLDVEVENLRLMYRRDLAQARVTTTRGRFERALEQYEKAVESLDRCSGSDNAEMANLYVEMADVAEADENEEKAGQFYKIAYKKYLALGMEDEAKAIESKLPQEDPEEEEIRDGASGVQSDVAREVSDVQRPNTPGDEFSGHEEKNQSEGANPDSDAKEQEERPSSPEKDSSEKSGTDSEAQKSEKEEAQKSGNDSEAQKSEKEEAQKSGNDSEAQKSEKEGESEASKASDSGEKKMSRSSSSRSRSSRHSKHRSSRPSSAKQKSDHSEHTPIDSEKPANPDE